MYPWRKLSVYKAAVGDIEDRNMDEHIVLSKGKAVKAKKDSKHLSFRGLEFFTKKANWYSTREAVDYFEDKKISKENANFKTRIKMRVYYKLPLGFRSWLIYFIRYYLQLGFLDGKVGKIYYFLSIYWYRFLVDAKIYEHEKLNNVFSKNGELK